MGNISQKKGVYFDLQLQVMTLTVVETKAKDFKQLIISHLPSITERNEHMHVVHVLAFTQLDKV